MPIPVWVLLGFAGWTILVLIGTIAVYRWGHILTGRNKLIDFPADVPHGADWYRRAMRAHVNCVENLPIYTAIVVAMIVAHVQSPYLDTLAIIIITTRILQSLTHIFLPMTNVAVGIRFSFFAIQLTSMILMGLSICNAVLA